MFRGEAVTRFRIFDRILTPLHLLNFHHWGRLRAVHVHEGGLFIPEWAIHSQVENTFDCEGRSTQF